VLSPMEWKRDSRRDLLNFCEASIIVNDVKRPSQFGQEREA
jgi:hypothetical protein